MHWNNSDCNENHNKFKTDILNVWWRCTPLMITKPGIHQTAMVTNSSSPQIMILFFFSKLTATSHWVGRSAQVFLNIWDALNHVHLFYLAMWCKIKVLLCCVVLWLLFWFVVFFVSCCVVSCCVMLCCVVSCRVMSCHVMSYHVMSCHAIICCDIKCHVVLSCRVMSCHVV